MKCKQCGQEKECFEWGPITICEGCYESNLENIKGSGIEEVK